MGKKQIERRKMALKKETLRVIATDDLAVVAGGLHKYSYKCTTIPSLDTHGNG